MKRLIFLLAVMTCVAFQTLAQGTPGEVGKCSNGIDDDGDGFIDCFDGECKDDPFCDGFYIGNDNDCDQVPDEFPQFTMTLDFSSPNETTNHINRMAIGDLDRDGLPEIITLNRYTKKLYILRGTDGSVKKTVNISYDAIWEAAIANIDNDACAEIFFAGVESGSLYFYMYDCDLNEIWKSKIRDQNGSEGEAMDPINYGLADFDGDGKVELYCKDMIFDAHTGVRIINTASSTDKQWNNINGGPVAVDILGDDNLELVIGCKIYDVTLGSRTANSGTLTLLQSVPNYFVRWPYNATSVADYNLDGFLDVIASGSTKDGSSGNPRNTSIFFWDVHNNVVKTFFDNSAGAYLPNGWDRGTGRVNIADLDGDGQLNLSYVSGKFLYALDENMNLKWRVIINEETSGHTGCTLFDFNGDGSSEIVYRDERFIYIIKGNDGSIYTQQTCVSRTQREYPIVADVDADGSTEICVVCGFNDADAADNFNDLGYSRYSHVRVFKSASEPWVPARRLWNQHGYFNVNVNNDLTIPRKQQKHHLVFSNIPCAFGPQGPTRPLNNFLNQSPFLDSRGCPTYSFPDLAFGVVPTEVTPQCPDLSFPLSFEITNIGDVPLSGNVPITFYSADPRLPGAVKLNTVTAALSALDTDEIFVVNATVTGIGSSSIFIVLNDAGTSVPTPISLPNTAFIECNYDNVIEVQVNYTAVPITALVVQNNETCSSGATAENGTVRAFIATSGGGENTLDYNFYWTNGGTALPIPADFTGPIYTGLAAGDYTVFARHKTANCLSQTLTVTVTDATPDPLYTAQIFQDHAYDNCQTPNGALHVVVSLAGVAQPTANYTYEWYPSATVGGGGASISNSASVTGLIGTTTPGQPYTVLITDKATGCQLIETFNILDETTPPVVIATAADLNCTAGSTTDASASVNGGGTTGFTLRWYIGSTVKPTPDNVGPVYANRPAGTYTVVAEDDVSHCLSAPAQVTIIQTPGITVAAFVTSAMTSCDPSLPNGAARAEVTGVAATFEWFIGQNTSGTPYKTGPNISGENAGIYTVRATDPVTGCTDTEEVTIDFNVITPSLILGAVGGVTNCTTPDGSITVSVDLDTPAEYTFSWYIGPSATDPPDFPDTDNVLNNLPVGTYTVQAKHNTKNCVTAPISADVIDNTPIIAIDLDGTVTQPPSDCNANNGEMTVDVSAPGNTVEGFRIEWFRGFTPSGVPVQPAVSGVFSSTATGLGTGLYSVLATNLRNGCSASDTFNLPFLNAHHLQYVSQVNVDNCSPTNIGQITVRLLKSPPVAGVFSEADYDIIVHSGTSEAGPVIETIPGVDTQTIYNTASNLTPGFYTLVAISNNPLTPGCKSEIVVVEIKQVTTNPLIQATSIDANTNCAGTTADGQITLNIDGAAPESNYSYQWFEGPTVSSNPLGTATTGTTNGVGNIAQSLPPGMYTVRVVNTSTPNTGCAAVSSFQVFDNPPIITMNAGDIVVAPLTVCPPLASDASATVTNIRENGVSVGIAGYTFEWFTSAMVQFGPSTASVTNLAAGTYFVRATNTASNCAAALIQFEVEDQTINVVAMSLADFVQPTLCLKPGELLGSLQVDAGPSAPANYTVNWYNGAVVAGLPIFTGPTLSGFTVPTGQPSVTFTAEVIENTSQCRISETYVVPLDIRPVTLIASTSPITSCITNDGQLFAAVTSGVPSAYNYNWSIGDVVKAIPDFTGRPIANQPVGNYTVVAIETAEPRCVSNSVTVTLGLDQIPPVVVAIPLNPVTICDPTQPDGAASATVNGGVAGYTFDWFAGGAPFGTPIYSGPQIDGLTATLYTVIATNIVSGCTGSAEVTINSMPTPVPTPQITVLSNVTMCAPRPPDGALSSSVNGNTVDYKFFWYNSDPGVNPDTTTADFKGAEYYTGLAAGTYYVSVVSRITGCAAGPVSATITDNPQIPDFNFTIESATCKRDDSDPGDGFVTISLINPTDLDIDKIFWIEGSLPLPAPPHDTIAVGPNLTEADAGTYTVTVVTAQGCQNSKEVEIKSDIRPFNGISRNGDDQNSFFKIICLEDFPNNLVKIFNRAGTLVYEAEGYDNQAVLFDGKSNKGLSVMGNDLPDGTYFYIIDKRDGTKPVAGYLEIVN